MFWISFAGLGLTGILWVVRAEAPVWHAVVPAAAMALSVAAVDAWQRSRRRARAYARQRWLTALDSYASREIARAAQRRENHRLAALTQYRLRNTNEGPRPANHSDTRG